MVEECPVCSVVRPRGRIWSALMAAACLAASGASAGNPQSPAQLREARHTAAEFLDLAGSPRNAWALVQGLRWGTAVTLASPGPSPQHVTFTSPVRRMGYGSVARALRIARKELASRGIARPTPSQLQTVLIGGTLRTGEGAFARVVRTPGILPLRHVRLGWGQIAHALAISPTGREVALASH